MKRIYKKISSLGFLEMKLRTTRAGIIYHREIIEKHLFEILELTVKEEAYEEAIKFLKG